MIEEDPTFMEAFWAWFDSLPLKEKERWWYLPVNFATLYFYNKFYSKNESTPS